MRRDAMLAAERQVRILRVLDERGVVRVAELAELLGVTPMTIRRDLDRLASHGKLTKVRGGATSGGAGCQQTAEEESIASAAAAMVRPGSTIGLSAGTTTSMVARHLRAIPGLTVVTNSVRVADVLHEGGAGAPDVVLTGGERTATDALVGRLAVSSLRRLHLDVVFLGVHGIHPVAGLTTSSPEEAEVDRALAEAGQRLVVLADHATWGRSGASTILPLSRVDVLVSDTGLGHEGRAAMVRARVDVVLAARRAHAPSA